MTKKSDGPTRDGSGENAMKDRDADMNTQLDEALEDSMDASDPPSSTKPGDDGKPVPSSGYRKQD
jgi:hypothetical protein